MHAQNEKAARGGGGGRGGAWKKEEWKGGLEEMITGCVLSGN